MRDSARGLDGPFPHNPDQLSEEARIFIANCNLTTGYLAAVFQVTESVIEEVRSAD